MADTRRIWSSPIGAQTPARSGARAGRRRDVMAGRPCSGGRAADRVHGTTISTGGTGATACCVTVTNGRTTQARSNPSAVPAMMLIAASPALSSDSHADSWPPDRPTARSSANSVTRSRADTAALTTNPRTAKTAAAMNPIANAPMTPSATGSVARTRARSTWLTTESLPIVVASTARPVDPLRVHR